MGASPRAARAGLALASLLLALALPPPGPAGEPCLHPSESSARERHTAEVRCGAPGQRTLRGPARRLFDLPLDPNVCDAATLETLPGIGPVRARAIVEERRRRPFARVGELSRVHGIGPRTVERLAGLLAIRGGEPGCGPPSAKPVGCRSMGESSRGRVDARRWRGSCVTGGGRQ